jgi:hypothetical protein
MFRLGQRCGPFRGVGDDETTLSRLVNGTAVVTVQKVVRAPSSIRRRLWCQMRNGSMDAAVDDFKPSSLDLVQGREFERPALICPYGSHAAKYEMWAMDSAGNKIPGWDTGSWTADPHWTDTTDPNARCMALSGNTPCEVQPLADPNVGIPATWANTNPATGVITDAQTGERVGVSDGCIWGTRTYEPEECYPGYKTVWDTWNTRTRLVGNLDATVYLKPAEDPEEEQRRAVGQCLRLANEDLCKSKRVFLPGSDVLKAAQHKMDAISGAGTQNGQTVAAGKVLLTFVPPGDSRRPSPQWYESMPECQGNSILMHCDEYPYRSTMDGGRDRAALKLVNAPDNRNEGTLLQSFYQKCTFVSDDQFLVIPLEGRTDSPASGLNTQAWCGPGESAS